MIGGTIGGAGGVGDPTGARRGCDRGGQQEDQKPSGSLRAEVLPSAGLKGFSGCAQTATPT